MFDLPWDKTPDFVNEAGVKWWADRDITAYAREKLKSKAVVFYVEEPSGYRTRLLVENDQILNDDQTYEGMCCHIDMLWAARNMK